MSITGELFTTVTVSEEAEDTMVEKDNVPKVGMDFKSAKDVWKFYRSYAAAVGFPIRKRTSRKGDNGSVKYVTYACSREGGRCYATTCSLNPQPTIQTDCKARLIAKEDLLGTWQITKVHHEHNHTTSPSKSRLYRCNRYLNQHVKRKLEVNDIAGIPLHKNFNSTVVEVGDYSNMTFTEKDCRNYVEKVRRLRLGEGDAAAILA
ncbi:unnamed protein product [Cuscuta europaea]|uniref:FAR1 domain-containing protein n=1 Tax=Cuscuta europaea TaxID=41803 RepID=A0A9P0ZVN0_CUSEU|nr:unnamed protein product [Cuscuta europaea]